MSNTLLAEFTQKVPDLSGTNIFDFRKRQYHFCDLLKELITEVVQKPFNENTLTALIQISKNRSKDNNIEKYLGLLELPDESREKYLKEMLAVNQSDRGLTGAGKSSISPVRMMLGKGEKENSINSSTKEKYLAEGLAHFETFRELLKKASECRSFDEAVSAVKEFVDKKVPMIKEGIYSPLLCYLKPEFFPIANNGTKDYYKSLDWNGKDYISLMSFTSSLLVLFKDKNHLLLDALTRGRVKYQVHPSLKPKKPRVFIEKTYPKDGLFREMLMSPDSGDDGRDTYKNMRKVMPDDIVLHFINNNEFVGVSRVADYHDEVEASFSDAEEESTHYQVKLKDYIELDPNLPRNLLFTDENEEVLNNIRVNSGKKKIFYNKNFEMNQGAYLTDAPIELCRLISRIYEREFSKEIPYLSEAFGSHEYAGVQHWMIGCGVDGKYWDEFLERGQVTIGWEDLGDHSKFKSRDEVESKYIETYKPESRPTNDALAIWEFSHEMKEGDIVFAKIGRKKFLAAGVVKSKSVEYDATRKLHQMIQKIEWLKIKEHTYTDGGVALKTLTNINQYTRFVKNLRQIYELDKSNNEDNEMSKTSLDQLNTILFGPPGTGKTYEVRKMALDIITGGNAPEEYDQVVKEFNRFKEEGQVEFVTFHPNFGYENFVEGIFPDTENSEVLTYRRKSGVFKNICDEALKNLLNSGESNSTEVEDEFEARWRRFVDEIEDGEGSLVMKTLNGAEFLVRHTDTDGSYIFRNTTGTGHHIAKKRYFKVFKHLVETGIKEPERKDINVSSLQTYMAPILRRLFTYDDIEIARSNEERKNYVLIIDEINRGNIPAIFGELITLIEPSKRLGSSEALKLTLPLSEEDFGVPKNLYIIGTMNTADRSVEALDAALRRRFSFIPKYPENNHSMVGKVGDVDLSKMLERINKRVKVLKGDDYHIGHSYFMNISDEDSLREAFENKVIPLLNEYFYEDLKKVQMILGDSFVKSTPVESGLMLGDESDIEDFDLYELISSSEWKFKKIYE